MMRWMGWIMIGLLIAAAQVSAHDAKLDVYGCHRTASTADAQARECHEGLLKGQTFPTEKAELVAYIAAQQTLLLALQAKVVALEDELKNLKPPLDVKLQGVTAGEVIVCGETSRALVAVAAEAVRVEFYSGSNLMTTDLETPFGMSWSLKCVWTTVGQTTLKVIATGRDGRTAVHEVVVTVALPPPLEPEKPEWASAVLMWEWNRCTLENVCGGDLSYQTVECQQGETPLPAVRLDPTVRTVAVARVVPKGTGPYTCRMVASSQYVSGDVHTAGVEPAMFTFTLGTLRMRER